MEHDGMRYRVKAGIYVRISRDREGTELGVKRQEADCRALAERRGWTVADVYSDNDISATTGRRRPEWERLLADLRSGRIGAVVAYSTSRMYRRIVNLHPLMELARERGIKIDTVVDGRIDFSTATSRMVANILAATAQAEAEQIGERSSRAKADLKAQGKWLGGGAVSFGYRREKDARGKVVHKIDQREARVLRGVARRALAGESLNSLAREVGVQPSRLRSILNAPFHAGLFGDGTRGDWPAIFTEDDHRLLVARFPRRNGGQRPAVAYPLASLVVCGCCGKKMLGSGGSYRCQARNGGCGRNRARAFYADQFVVEEVIGRIPESPPESSPPPDDPAPLEELRALQVRQLEAREAYARGELALADFQGASRAIAGLITEAEGRIREVAPRPTPPPNFGKLATLRERWKAGELTRDEVEDFSSWLREHVERVEVAPPIRAGRGAEKLIPGRLAITWRS
jgi:site-specific DNA recombinase